MIFVDFFTNSSSASRACSILLRNAVDLNQLFAERMLQPSRFARCRGSACKACAFFLRPYRVTARIRTSAQAEAVK